MKLVREKIGWQHIKMKIILIFILSILSFNAIAQKSDTLVTYSLNGTLTKKADKATLIYKVFKKDSVSWVRITSNKDLIPIFKESFSDSLLTTLNGIYLEYEGGKIYRKGFYLNNERVGMWITYDTIGSATSSKMYASNNLNGLFTTYWDNGNIQEQGKYVDGKKVGEWRIIYQTGEIALKETFDLNSKIVDSAYLDLNGKAISKDSIFKAPSYPKGIQSFYKYLGSSVRYPVQARLNNIRGKVYLRFTINKQGEIVDIMVVSSPDRSLSEEAFRVLQNSPKWIPGRIFNKPTNVEYAININFWFN